MNDAHRTIVMILRKEVRAMKIKLNNIGKIHEAELELNGITAIAGENNTGKSTVGRALFTIFNSLYYLDQRVEDTRYAQISKYISEIFKKYNPDTSYFLNTDRIEQAILEHQKEYLHNDSFENLDNVVRLLRNNLIDFFSKDNDTPVLNKEMALEIIKQIRRVLAISKEQIYMQFFENRINWEFAKSIVNYHHVDDSAAIELSIQNHTTHVSIRQNKVDGVDGLIDLQTQAVYLDDPFILDEMGGSNGLFLRGLLGQSRLMKKAGLSSKNESTHRAHLKACLEEVPVDDMDAAMNQILVNNKIQTIINKIDGICHMQMRKNGDALETVFFEDGNKKISVENISTGLKTFLILRQLLYTGHLKENGLLILDEPEVHLHPEWQILFAEIIVLLQKEFGMHILLTTHSPHFLRAIEVYSARCRIADRCKYYLANLDGHDAVFEDVTTSTDQIYQKLVLPFEKLQRMIYDENR